MYLIILIEGPPKERKKNKKNDDNYNTYTFRYSLYSLYSTSGLVFPTSLFLGGDIRLSFIFTKNCHHLVLLRKSLLTPFKGHLQHPLAQINPDQSIFAGKASGRNGTERNAREVAVGGIG